MPRRFILCLMAVMLLFACSNNKKALQEDAHFVPEDAFKQANELIETGYYEDARDMLEDIKIRDPSQKYAILARLRIGDTYFDDELYEEAAVEYESFLSLYPYHKYASYAQYRLAMSFFKRIKTVDISYSWTRRALNEFRKLRQRYPRNPYMDIIDNRIKACLNILAEYEFYVGNFYYDKGSYKAAIGRFNGMLQDYPDSTRTPETLYYMGVSYENIGQREDAIRSLTRLLETYPSVEFSAKAKQLVDSFDKEK